MPRVKDGDIRVCTVCGSRFIYHKGSHDGSRCSRECSSEYQRRYKIANRDILLEKSRKYREDNRQKCIERSRKHREENRDRYLEYCRKYHKIHYSKQSFYEMVKRLYKRPDRVKNLHHINLIGFDNRPENLQPFKDSYEHNTVFHRYINDNHHDVLERKNLFVKLFNEEFEKNKHLIPTASQNSVERLKQNKKLKEWCQDYISKFKAEYPHDIDVNPQNYLPEEYRS